MTRTLGRTRKVAIAEIGAAHGLKGEVRLRSFTQEPMAVAKYGPLVGPDGRAFEIVSARPAGTSPHMLVVRFKGVADRNAAEVLTGTRLSVPYDRLPPADDGEFYHTDLVGLTVFSPQGETLGTVVAVQNHGAGDLLEIAPAGGASILVPFTEAAVPEVDIAGGRVVAIPPVFDDEGETP